MASAETARRNRLAQETSPYLLQHARNPVDWYPWGQEALTRAVQEDRPLLLSIGYSACHWCHVMERESFEDEAIAAFMNDHFVCVKVDREERPDLDVIYMTATVALNGSGGWPMTVFLTPDLRPFFAGTYFPPVGQHGRPGFPELLRRVAELWRSNRATAVDQARQLTAHVAAAVLPSTPTEVSGGAIDAAVAALDQDFDAENGGFGRAPKFPPCAALSLLLRHHRRTGQARALAMVRRTLDAMKNGGIYDQLGGGFARYSTDAEWLVPHFEKMLYDNAQLARVYLEAYSATADPEYARIATETLDFVLRELRDEEGGFFSSMDADSEGEEGKFFVWRPEDLAMTLNAEAARRFAAYYGVTECGNWEEKSILHSPRPMGVVAAELGVTKADLLASLVETRAAMLAARSKRIPPLKDDKVLTSWNGLAIGALAEGARVLGVARFRTAALSAARFALRRLRSADGGLLRTWRAGTAHVPGFLEDYAFLGDGLLDLYEESGDRDCFDGARHLAERMLTDFVDPAQGDFLSTAAHHEGLLVRPRDGHDGAVPSPNAVAARLLARLSWHLDRPGWRARAIRAIRAHGHEISRIPRAFATTLGVVELLLEGPIEVVLAGDPADPMLVDLRRAIGRRYLPNRVVAHALPDPTATPSECVLLVGRPGTGPATGFVCWGSACGAPARDPKALLTTLDEAERAQRFARQDTLMSPTVEGRATRAGTARYFSRLGASAEPRPLGTGAPSVSALGFGAYRVLEQSGEHRAALTAALTGGINLVDTATNYGGGSSETLVGQVIADLVAARAINRDEIVVVSKVGTLQGARLDAARARASAGDPWPEVVKYEDDVWHCIHPTFIEAELTGSLARLGLETLDVCLLHNPEYFLLEAARRGDLSLEASRAAFDARIEAAFRHLEVEVSRGRIAAYGVSSNTIAASAAAPGATEVARFLGAAQRAGGEGHSFRAVELPTNLLEPGSIGEDGAIAAAARHGLGVLVNRPLNAILGPGLTRLVDLPLPVADAPEVAPRLADLALLEGEFRESFAARLATRAGGEPPAALLDWARKLDASLEEVKSLEHCLEIEHQVVRPHTRRVLDTLDRRFEGELRRRWFAWRDGYVSHLEGALAALRARAADRSRERLGALRSAVVETLPEARRQEALARIAVWTVASLPGVSSVLVGMRRPAYVRELRPVLDYPPHPQPECVFAAATSGARAC
ncbi:MAG: DUF255 domain-containing protein [Polyangiaceae bacterium]|nr:DUF255 domain-containing protein [Polyangiaceae bacterium]